jgi:endonuclease/exonuclease/phosphatase family metal-dependent hydrolase
MLRQQLDHILYDQRRFDCVDARVLKRGRSDHLPVVALRRLEG